MKPKTVTKYQEHNRDSEKEAGDYLNSFYIFFTNKRSEIKYKKGMPINKTILTSPKYGRYTRPSIIKLGPAETVEPYAISTKYFRFCQILSQKPPAAGVDSGVTKKRVRPVLRQSRLS
jgi:hypothetical protein